MRNIGIDNNNSFRSMGVSFVVLLQVAMMLCNVHGYVRELSIRIELINYYLDEIDYVSRYHSLHGVEVAVVAVELGTIDVGMSFYTHTGGSWKKRNKRDET